MNTSGLDSIYDIPTPDSHPRSITAGPANAQWFTEYDTDKIAAISTDSGHVTEIPVPTRASGPRGIAVGPDGNMWFTEYTGNKIGRLTGPSITVAAGPRNDPQNSQA